MVANNDSEVLNLSNEVREEIIKLKANRSMTWEYWKQEVLEVTQQFTFKKFIYFFF